MNLKKLELKGFKSFADNTEIYLNPGINVIVGPNGCGKSNLVDAIRWVLGEANVRHLRGQKSEDVIFNGTDKSRALGMASVEMTLDNGDGVLPVDYSEVMVARKIFRSGESEFTLNKSRVRMKDIGNLFLGTGLGRKGYSIISQGELEQVLNGQPLDRRLILEEASGVIKYRQQRDEVNKRIAETGHDLLRVADILTELKQQEEDLAVKAEKANKYMRISTQLNRAEKELLQFELNKLFKDYTLKNTDLDLRRQELVLAKQNETEIISHLNEAEKLSEAIRTELSKLKDERFTIENKKHSLESEIRLSNERINNNINRIDTAALDEVKYKDLLTNIIKEVEARQEDYSKEKTILANKQEELDIHNRDLDKLTQEIGELTAEFEAEKAHIFSHMENESELRNSITVKEEEIRRVKEKKERATFKKEELSNNINNSRLSYTEFEEEIRALEMEIKAIAAELEELNESKSEAEVKLNHIGCEIDQLEKQLRLDNNSLMSLKDKEEKLLGYSPAVKAVFKANDELPGIMGVAGEILQVPEGLEVAIETAMGRGMENIIVDTSRSAQNVIAFLKRIKGGRVTLLPLDILKVQKLPDTMIHKLQSEAGVIGVASRLASFEPQFEKAVEYLLGRVLIVENMETGVKLFKKHNLPLRIVTLEGEVINTSGAMTGGAGNSNNIHSPLKRKSEEKRLIQVIGEVESKLKGSFNNQANIRQKLAQVEVSLNKTKEIAAEKQFKYDLLVKQMELLKKEITDTVARRQELLMNIDKMSQEIIELDKLIRAEQANLTKLQSTSETVSKQLENLKNDIEKKRHDYEIGRARLSSYQDYLAAKEKELTNIKHSVEQFEQVRNSYSQSLQEMFKIKDSLGKEIEQEQVRIVKLTAELKEQEQLGDNINRLIADKQAGEKKQSENLEKFKLILEPLKVKLLDLESFIHKNEITLTRLETELAVLEQKWRDKFLESPSQDKEIFLSPGEVRLLKANLIELQEEMNEMGPVDLSAVEAYEQIKQRVAFLVAQFEDLTKAKESLEKLLNETEKIMIKNFNQFFMLANESFKRTFSEIFGGGEAFLILDNEKERLEAGVNIQVKMPGKKLQALTLLSGGERALTCIAFIFGLLRLKPAPFCLLDEIDASLDETNLVRFSNFLKKMAEDMQFIIITHRQVTIECGENIFGVTMPEEGISSVLTLNLMEAESLAG